MKRKIILLMALCAFTLCSYAQTDKGQGLVGGSFSFGTSNKSRNSSALNNFVFAPRGGYFLAQNFAIGLEIPLSLSKLKNVSFTDFNEDKGYYETTRGPREFSFGLSPFARKYFDVKKRLKVFAQANLLLQINSTKIIDDDGYLIKEKPRLKGLGANLNPGIVYVFYDELSIEFSFPIVTYFHQSYYDEFSSYNYGKTNTVRLALDNFTPIVGLSYSF